MLILYITVGTIFSEEKYVNNIYDYKQAYKVTKEVA